MNAYKCDICKGFFEKQYHKIHTSIDLRQAHGHHTLQLMLRRDRGPDIIVFNGDICPNCYELLCEQLAARGCTEKEVLASANDYRKAFEEETKSLAEADTSLIEHFHKNASKPIGDFSALIEYLSQFDESDAVKVKYVRQKIEEAIGQSVDWYEKRRTHE